MLIKSGEGVVILTRPQKSFQSSPHPEGLTFFPPAAPDTVPRPTKIDAKAPQYSQNKPKKRLDNTGVF